MVICIILLALGAICLTLFLIEKVRKYSIKATLIKATTSFFFIALAAYSFYTRCEEAFGVYVICGLAMGLLGDIWLDFKYVFKEHERIFTFAGFISFAIGHVFYILGIIMTLAYPNLWYAYAAPLVFGLTCGALVILLEKPLKYKYGEYKAICFIYGTLLFTTLGTTLFLTVYHHFAVVTYNMLFAGAVLFAVSDLILCGTYFGEGKERPFDIISNGITYYAAQYLIAFSLFFLIL